jgi:hypothetical protein
LERRETSSIQTKFPKKSSSILWCSLEMDAADSSQHGVEGELAPSPLEFGRTWHLLCFIHSLWGLWWNWHRKGPILVNEVTMVNLSSSQNEFLLLHHRWHTTVCPMDWAKFEGWCWIEVQWWGDGPWQSHQRKERVEEIEQCKEGEKQRG